MVNFTSFYFGWNHLFVDLCVKRGSRFGLWNVLKSYLSFPCCCWRVDNVLYRFKLITLATQLTPKSFEQYNSYDGSDIININIWIPINLSISCGFVSMLFPDFWTEYVFVWVTRILEIILQQEATRINSQEKLCQIFQLCRIFSLSPTVWWFLFWFLLRWCQIYLLFIVILIIMIIFINWIFVLFVVFIPSLSMRESSLK